MRWCINRKDDGGLELPAKIVQARLGHASIVMTMDTYGHLFPSQDDGSELVSAELASRSRGTPRIANRLLRRVRDFAQVNEASVVTREIALAALELLEIDTTGFDKMDRAILGAIIDKFDGGPVGVESLAAAVGEESDTIEEVYEPYLLQEGFLARTSRGRVATQRAYTHLGRTRRGTLL